MTIGIAASGPGAGRAILEALSAAEGVGTGAIGGFLSFACITDTGLWRCGRQRGGARGFLNEGLPDKINAAPLAVLMSSGPDRPEPLSQFTPGADGVGLVTGHRFPNAPDRDGIALGAAALALMRQGAEPQAAASAVALANPTADAGLICLDLAGRIGQANTAYVAGFPGLGAADRSLGRTRVSVLCNAITPAASLAELIADIALAAMQSPPEHGLMLLSAGLPVRRGPVAELIVNADMEPVELQLPAPYSHEGAWCGGYGPLARLTQGGRLLGHLIDEPFLTGIGPRIEGIDGRSHLSIRFVRHGEPRGALAPCPGT